ncbi:rhoptry protein ROP5 [Besnoitia besnoiti]|uniref:Rhoptry protein ROP5 n=1 Tax=Besnoitia besnoiti TaxID=94643 RepID=A0A2A9M6F1_BESBE|nr:rhoptry protein ROP5 [Besnoitia besnoiti]PFH33529.1 rhoptry protein ROP5 [Besnoitia besnoiti]
MRHRLPGHVDRLRTWFTPFFASPTFRDDAEPGKHIIAGLISEMASGLANLVTVPSIDGDSETENRIQEAVRRSLRLSPLDAGQEIAVTSENTGGTRVFQVGGLVAQGTDGVAFQVTDLETNSHRVLKGFVMRAPETERQITERIIRLGRVLQKSWRRMSADDALTKLRFLAPQDFVRFAEADDPFLVVGIVPNAFFVYPHPATSLDRVLLVMREDERVRTSAGARLLLLSATTQVIRLAACYHTLGLVHGHLHPGSFFVSEDGRLLLGSSRDVYQQGGTYDTVRHRSMLAAPEFTSHRFTYTYGYDSWQLGVILYYLWCGQYPHGLGQSSSVPHADSSTELSFSSRDCLFAPVPSPVQNLIQAFLQRSRWRRVLARKAFSSEDYKRVVAATLELVGELESDPGSQ